MNVNKIKDKIIEPISRSLDWDLYMAQEDSLDYDDFEMEQYRDRLYEIHESYQEVFELVRKSVVIELKDDDLKVQVFESMKKGKVLRDACKCLNVENMKFYNLVYDGRMEVVRDCRIAHVFCKNCEEYSGKIYYYPDED